jgi:hypothetical protein
MLVETEWLDMFITLQIVGGLLLVAFLYACRRGDDDNGE